jgi:hypothetical protein
VGLVLPRRTAAWPLMLAAFLSILTLACTLPPPPSDQELVLGFTRDSANYQRVMTMFAADTNIGAIASDLLWPVGRWTPGNATAREVGITEARLAEYRRIMTALGVIHLGRWGPDQVMFATWATGFAGNTHHRGIAWLSKPTSSIAWRRFRVIKAPWYMFEH